MNQQQIQSITSAIIAILSIATAGFISIWDTVYSKPLTDVPPWLALLIGAIIGAYYTHNASTNGARQAGVAAAQTAIEAEKNSHPTA